MFDIDIVMCIDKASSMLPFIDEVKEKALRFPLLFAQEMVEQKNILHDLG